MALLYYCIAFNRVFHLGYLLNCTIYTSNRLRQISKDRVVSLISYHCKGAGIHFMQARQFLLPLETLIQSPISRKSPIRVMGFRSENSAFAEEAVPVLLEPCYPAPKVFQNDQTHTPSSSAERVCISLALADSLFASKRNYAYIPSQRQLRIGRVWIGTPPTRLSRGRSSTGRTDPSHPGEQSSFYHS